MLGHTLSEGKAYVANVAVIQYKIQFIRLQIKLEPRNFFFERVAVKHDYMPVRLYCNFDIQAVCFIYTNDEIRQVTNRWAFRIRG